MKNILISAAIAIGPFLGCKAVQPKTATDFMARYYVVDDHASSGVVGFSVDSVRYTDDYTRIYGKLIGIPHTSERIDTLEICLTDGSKNKSTDIDGVDIQRWFQWEDSNYIKVEIDFPSMPQQRSFNIQTTGPRGNSRWEIVSHKK